MPSNSAFEKKALGNVVPPLAKKKCQFFTVVVELAKQMPVNLAWNVNPNISWIRDKHVGFVEVVNKIYTSTHWVFVTVESTENECFTWCGEGTSVIIRFLWEATIEVWNFVCLLHE